MAPTDSPSLLSRRTSLTFLSLFRVLPQEFEVIAQIKLLQSACNSYCLTPEPLFLRWFKNQSPLSEEERCESFCACIATHETAASRSSQSAGPIVKHTTLAAPLLASKLFVFPVGLKNSLFLQLRVVL